MLPNGGIAPTSQSANRLREFVLAGAAGLFDLQQRAHLIEIDLRRGRQHQHHRLAIDRGDEDLGDVLAFLVQHGRHFLHGVHLAMLLHFKIHVMVREILLQAIDTCFHKVASNLEM